MRGVGLLVLAVVGVACGTKSGEATIAVTLNPKIPVDANPSVLSLSALDGFNKVGTGSVKVTSTFGSLVTPQTVTLDKYGTASLELTCDPGVERECAQSLRVVAEWVTGGETIYGEFRINPSNGGGAGTGDTGAGGAGGSGSGGARVVTAECMEEKPILNLSPNCCTPGDIYRVPCGATVVTNGATVTVPFSQEDGGVVMLGLKAVVPFPATAAECDMAEYGFQLTTPGYEGLSLSYSGGPIDSTGHWSSGYGGGGDLIGTLPRSMCDAEFAAHAKGLHLDLGLLSVREISSNEFLNAHRFDAVMTIPFAH